MDVMTDSKGIYERARFGMNGHSLPTRDPLLKEIPVGIKNIRTAVKEDETTEELKKATEAVINAPSDMYTDVIADDDKRAASKVTLFVKKQLVQQFWEAYMAPVGLNDINNRLGTIVGTVDDVHSVFPLGIPGLLSTDTKAAWRANLNYSFKFTEFPKGGKDGEDIEYIYNSYAFPPFKSYEVFDLNEAFAKVQPETDDSKYEANINFDMENLVYRQNIGTARSPAFKQVNDNIQLLQLFLSRCFGIESTYMNEWDLSLYMQEGLCTYETIEDVNGTTKIPKFASNLTYGLLDDAPVSKMVPNMDPGKEGEYVDQSVSMGGSEFIEHATPFASINMAISTKNSIDGMSMAKHNNTYSYEINHFPLSAYWTPADDGENDTEHHTWRTEDIIGHDANNKPVYGRTSGMFNVSRYILDFFAYKQSGKLFDEKWGKTVNENGPYYTSRNFRGSSLKSSSRPLLDIIHYNDSREAILSIWNSTDNAGKEYLPDGNYNASGEPVNNGKNSNAFAYLPFWKQFFANDEDGLTEYDQYLQELFANDAPETSFLSVAYQLVTLATADNEDFNNAISSREKEIYLNSLKDYTEDDVDTIYDDFNTDANGIGQENIGNIKIKVFKWTVEIPKSELLNRWFHRNDTTRKANAQADNVGAKTMNIDYLINKGSQKVVKGEDDVSSSTTNQDGMDVETTYYQLDPNDIPKQNLTYGDGVAVYNPFIYGGPHGKFFNPLTLEGYTQAENRFLSNVPTMDPYYVYLNKWKTSGDCAKNHTKNYKVNNLNYTTGICALTVNERRAIFDPDFFKNDNGDILGSFGINLLLDNLRPVNYSATWYINRITEKSGAVYYGRQGGSWSYIALSGGFGDYSYSYGKTTYPLYGYRINKYQNGRNVGNIQLGRGRHYYDHWSEYGSWTRDNHSGYFNEDLAWSKTISLLEDTIDYPTDWVSNIVRNKRSNKFKLIPVVKGFSEGTTAASNVDTINNNISADFSKYDSSPISEFAEDWADDARAISKELSYQKEKNYNYKGQWVSATQYHKEVQTLNEKKRKDIKTEYMVVPYDSDYTSSSVGSTKYISYEINDKWRNQLKKMYDTGVRELLVSLPISDAGGEEDLAVVCVKAHIRKGYTRTTRKILMGRSIWHWYWRWWRWSFGYWTTDYWWEYETVTTDTYNLYILPDSIKYVLPLKPLIDKECNFANKRVTWSPSIPERWGVEGTNGCTFSKVNAQENPANMTKNRVFPFDPSFMSSYGANIKIAMPGTSQGSGLSIMNGGVLVTNGLFYDDVCKKFVESGDHTVKAVAAVTSKRKTRRVTITENVVRKEMINCGRMGGTSHYWDLGGRGDNAKSYSDLYVYDTTDTQTPTFTSHESFSVPVAYTVDIPLTNELKEVSRAPAVMEWGMPTTYGWFKLDDMFASYIDTATQQIQWLGQLRDFADKYIDDQSIMSAYQLVTDPKIQKIIAKSVNHQQVEKDTKFFTGDDNLTEDVNYRDSLEILVMAFCGKVGTNTLKDAVERRIHVIEELKSHAELLRKKFVTDELPAKTLEDFSVLVSNTRALLHGVKNAYKTCFRNGKYVNKLITLSKATSYNLIENPSAMLWAYLNVLYQSRKYWINLRMNKQNGSYWNLRGLERVLTFLDAGNSAADNNQNAGASVEPKENTYETLKTYKIQYVKARDSFNDRVEKEEVSPVHVGTVWTNVNYLNVPDPLSSPKYDPETKLYDGKEIVYVNEVYKWAYKPIDGLYYITSNSISQTLKNIVKSENEILTNIAKRTYEVTVEDLQGVNSLGTRRYEGLSENTPISKIYDHSVELSFIEGADTAYPRLDDEGNEMKDYGGNTILLDANSMFLNDLAHYKSSIFNKYLHANLYPIYIKWDIDHVWTGTDDKIGEWHVDKFQEQVTADKERTVKDLYGTIHKHEGTLTAGITFGVTSHFDPDNMLNNLANIKQNTLMEYICSMNGTRDLWLIELPEDLNIVKSELDDNPMLVPAYAVDPTLGIFSSDVKLKGSQSALIGASSKLSPIKETSQDLLTVNTAASLGLIPSTGLDAFNIMGE